MARSSGIPQRIDEAVQTLFFIVVAYDIGRSPLGGWGRLIAARDRRTRATT